MPDHLRGEQRVVGRDHQHWQWLRQGFQRGQNACGGRARSRYDRELSFRQHGGELGLALRQGQILQAKKDALHFCTSPQGIEHPQEHRPARNRHQSFVREADGRGDRVGGAPAPGQHERGERPATVADFAGQGHARVFS
jgi:hypothetical protein